MTATNLFMKPLFPLLSLVAFTGCNPGTLPDRELDYWSDEAGQPIANLSADALDRYNRGRAMMDLAFNGETGLGPFFNADSCTSCHQFPVAGGSSPRYRDLFLVQAQREDGAMISVGTNGNSPVRNLYAMEEGFVSEPHNTTLYARRNAPSGLGVGLFEFVSDQEILTREDPDDKNNDGISGRANYEQGEVGRFGYKAQATSLESFNRGALINQMGITTDPIYASFPESWDNQETAFLQRLGESLISSAYAQVAAPDEPTVDDDGVADPEMSNEDQLDLLFFSTYLAPLRPSEPTPQTKQGAKAFNKANCAACHTPSLKSTIGPLYAYSDLLLHDMGPEFAEDLSVSLASTSEFRTQPLWGVSLHGPYLHDGRADTLEEAILMHGGEAETSRNSYEAFDSEDKEALLAFLKSLGGWDADGQILIQPHTQDYPLGANGGPDQELNEEERAQWDAGRLLFDKSATESEGLGIHFNADSCRACHQDPVLGGAGGVDTNVLRFGRWDDEETYHALDAAVLPRQVLPGGVPNLMDETANVVEWRNPPTILGVGTLDRIADSAILANADPEDEDGDGISGRARILADGRLGRLGWKAQVPTVRDFVGDALLNETGQTVDVSLTSFTIADDQDAIADPELGDDAFINLTFFVEHLAPPVGTPSEEPEKAASGAELFQEIGCAACHLPSLDGVAAYSDLLLHDISPSPVTDHVSQEQDVEPTEFRTPPLWGITDTGPYMHDGRASSISAAIQEHAGEAAAAQVAFEALSEEDKQALLLFLNSL